MNTMESAVVEDRDVDIVEGHCVSGSVPRTLPVPATRPTATTQVKRICGVLTGTLIGFRDEGQTPLVLYPGQPGTAALGATSTIDLHGTHIGRQVALLFENSDGRRPMIVGLLRPPQGWPLPEQPGQVEVEGDGERLLVSAKEQLVLRCGRASITLTKSGKVLIEGAYVSNRSSGVMRVKGGSVQIN
jgi:hypothetical protein